MEDFSNNTIDTAQLPRFEEVELSQLHPSYIKIICINIAIVFGVWAIGAAVLMYFEKDVAQYWTPIAISYIVVLLITIAIQVVSYRNRGFAFRTHDVIYRTGAIAITTTIIPYNRVQHVALHEGWLSRTFGLAAVSIYTAGGVSSDIKIPGLEKEHAEAIKQLLIGKMQDIKEQEVPEIQAETEEPLHEE